MVLASPATYPTLMMGRRRPAYNKSDVEPGSFGEFIRHMREDVLNLTQPDFAALVDDNMDPSDVSQLERGKVGLPKPPRMIALARALGMPPAALYAEAGYPELLEGVPALRDWTTNPDLRQRVRAFLAEAVADSPDPERAAAEVAAAEDEIAKTVARSTTSRNGRCA
jgi:transcriptional regulator with XRE-family HTH domain